HTVTINLELDPVHFGQRRVVLNEEDGYRVHFGVGCDGGLVIGDCDCSARLHTHRVSSLSKMVVPATLPRNLRMLQCKKADPGPRARGPLGAGLPRRSGFTSRISMT